jgi:type IV secretion system protein VirB4
MFINHFYVTLVVRGGATSGDKIIQMFKRKTVANAARGPLIDDALVELLDDKAQDFEKLLARCEPRRCRVYGKRQILPTFR